MATYAWSRLDLEAGLGLVRVESGDAIRVEGYEVAVDGARSWVVTFDVRLDDRWRTREAEIVVKEDQQSRRVHLESDGEGGWDLDGVPTPALDGCLDVDIAATPFTNTFVIRRLDIPVGEVGNVKAVWVGVPDLEVAAMDQTYRHLDPLAGTDRYEYRSETSSDGWVIEVDEDGVALSYEALARRVHPQPATA